MKTHRSPFFTITTYAVIAVTCCAAVIPIGNGYQPHPTGQYSENIDCDTQSFASISWTECFCDLTCSGSPLGCNCDQMDDVPVPASAFLGSLTYGSTESVQYGQCAPSGCIELIDIVLCYDLDGLPTSCVETNFRCLEVNTTGVSPTPWTREGSVCTNSWTITGG